MKKTLLLGVAAMMASTAFAVEPTIIDGLYCMGISPDGKTMVCVDEGNMTIVNLETGQKTFFEGNSTVDSYSLGQGNSISSNGVIVGSGYEGKAAYYKGGEWFDLNTPNARFTSTAEGITPDGLRICGKVGTSQMSIDDTPIPQQVPVIWDLQSDGTYGDPVELPYPNEDFTGRVPTYVSAIAISDDGRTVVGQIYDYSGGYITLIYYTQGDDNEWTYHTEFDKVANPTGLEFPEWPGDSPTAPMAEDYMTDEEKAAYDAAVDECYNQWNAGNYDYPYPEMSDFMSEEAKAAYEAAKAEWEAAMAEWQPKFDAFDAALMQLSASGGRSLVFNNVMISPDGKKVVSSAITSVENDDPLAWSPFVEKNSPTLFYLEGGDYYIYPADDDVCASVYTEDGTIFGFTPDDMDFRLRHAMVYLPGQTAPVTLVEYYEQKDAETAEWVKANMVHEMEVYDMETYEPYMAEVDCTGVPFATPDLSMVATSVMNLWDEFGELYYSYVLPGYPTGVKCIASDRAEAEVKAFRGGRIAIAGEASRVTVYDAEGRVAYDAVPAGNLIETGLSAGAYIVKVETAAGTKVVKALF